LAEIRDISQIREKWARVTPQRAPEYSQGVQNPRRDWARAAVAAEDAYAAGVQQAVSEKRRAAGINRVTSAKWQRRAVEKGAPRFGPGVMIAAPDYEAGFAPFVEVIRRTTLPPKGRKGDPNNIQRVAVIATALHQARIRTGGGGGGTPAPAGR
jgi:hypothetical protein